MDAVLPVLVLGLEFLLSARCTSRDRTNINPIVGKEVRSLPRAATLSYRFDVGNIVSRTRKPLLQS